MGTAGAQHDYNGLEPSVSLKPLVLLDPQFPLTVQSLLTPRCPSLTTRLSAALTSQLSGAQPRLRQLERACDA